MKCHYEVLSVARDAEEAEIKTAYKKLALRWHPDKNLDNAVEAKEQFQLVQQAYEVLCDRQERAWYDNHREQILRGSSKDYEDNCLDVFQYFTTSCFTGYGDDEAGFYAVYNKVFETIAKEEMEYVGKEEFCDIPMFGNSKSDYDATVSSFYNYWLGYSTKRSYVWVDPYPITSEMHERRLLKLMEKENKKVRSKAKKERNEEVRNLVAFVRKRDKRVQAFAKLLEARAMENKQKQEEIASQRHLARLKEIKETKIGEWMKSDNMKSELKEIEKSMAQEFGEELSDSELEDIEDEEDYCDDLYCIACSKLFKTPKAFENHASSKKHKEKLKFLQETMQREEEDLLKEANEVEDDEEESISDCEKAIASHSESEEESIIEKEDKRKKNKKRNKKVLLVESEVVESEISIVCNEDSDDFSKQKTKKKGKKQKAKKDQPKQDEVPVDAVKEEVEEIPAPVKGGRKKKPKKDAQVTNGAEDIDKDHCCVSCKANFDSKNKLFEHLKKTGHSVYFPKESNSHGKNSKRKNCIT